MAREIKFRAKNTKNEWVYGDYAELATQRDYLAPSIIDTGFVHAVNPETLGQYTGLTDKNGKEIYEGDVVDYPNNGINEVKLEKGCYWLNGHILGHLNPDHLEAVGNIHENPELLGGE